MEFEFCKLEVFVPQSHLEQVAAALQGVDAGHIGNYDSCLSHSPVTGRWRPLPGTDPYLGEEGRVCEAPEVKVEVTIRVENLAATVAAVKAVHPYEEPVVNAIPLLATGL